MKILLYIILIIIAVLIICGLYCGLTNVDFTSVSESVTTAFNNAASWINNIINDIGSQLTE